MQESDQAEGDFRLFFERSVEQTGRGANPKGRAGPRVGADVRRVGAGGGSFFLL